MAESAEHREAIVVVGPTAAGKTDYAVALALSCGGEVVSADSMQVYVGLDKGTAKPSAEEMRGVPHHMIDVADPHEDYSVAQFAAAARRCIDDIFARGKVPVVCGGSGLYVNALIFDMGLGEDITAQRRMRQHPASTSDELYAELVRRDPLAAWGIHPNNVKRIRRALDRLDAAPELRPFSGSFVLTRQFTPRIIRLAPDREALYRRIDARVDAFIANGLVGEVRGLLADGVGRGTTAMQGIGYKEIAAYLGGECTQGEAVTRIKYATHHLAKRQETWFRRYEGAEIVRI
ncbi:MAG: tRNA (adenosine(37)-N6)-dimethylallyltransferase MiaA [Clostridiales Family XIII bacterium]|jgi:tRNA dimethylallyltransferase|nr:tRNA (adenosine(37)-N6)-dimethylallyltransferase MiaA [Clostridiales Family XIII bacterium]